MYPPFLKSTGGPFSSHQRPDWGRASVKIFIGCDHAGNAQKVDVAQALKVDGHDANDVGPHGPDQYTSPISPNC